MKNLILNFIIFLKMMKIKKADLYIIKTLSQEKSNIDFIEEKSNIDFIGCSGCFSYIFNNSFVFIIFVFYFKKN
jgi:hypothetical protein